MIRILLVDDHALFRAGMKALLQSMKAIEVVGEANNGRDAIRLVEQEQPDIVLMDIAMPTLNGLDTTRHIVRKFPDVRVIILSMHTTRQYVLQALEAGASGYLVKDAALGELEAAVRAVAQGETFLSSSVSKFVVDEYKRRLNGTEISSGAAENPLDILTPRQREVLQLIAEGYSTKEIAQKLDISVKTADVHRTELMKRLDIHDIAGLVRYAIRTGIVEPQA